MEAAFCVAGVLLLCRLLQPSPILQTELGADSSVPLPQAMDHRRAAALLVLSAAAAVLGHTHEEVVVDSAIMRRWAALLRGRSH